MQVVILAGGKGTRLRPIVSDKPKCLAPIQDTPFLIKLLDYLSRFPFVRVHLCLGYMAEQVITAISKKKYNFDLTYSVEKSSLGTGGAIMSSLHLMPDGLPLIVINGDTFTELDYKKFFETTLKSPDVVKVVLTKLKDADRYSVAEIDGQTITCFKKVKSEKAVYINAGIYGFYPNTIKNLNIQSPFSFEEKFLESKEKIVKLEHFIYKGTFIDIGIPGDYVRAQEYIPKM